MVRDTDIVMILQWIAPDYSDMYPTVWVEAVTAVHVGEHIRLAMDRYGIGVEAMSKRLYVSRRAVYGQWREENPKRRTIEAYAAAMSEDLADRGIPLRFTVESLFAGPDAVPVEPASDPVYTRHQSQQEPPTPPGTIRVRRFDGISCGSLDPAAEAPGVSWVAIRKETARAGATPDNTVMVVARGESMGGAGIHDGYELIVRRDWTPQSGQIVACQLAGATAVRRYTDTPGGPLLVSQPADGAAAEYHPIDGDKVLGVVVYAGWPTV